MGFLKPVTSFIFILVVIYDFNVIYYNALIMIRKIKKSYRLSKAYYIKFKYRKDSVFCYSKVLFGLKKYITTITKILFNMFTGLEEKVYEFYSKKYPQKGPLIK